MKLYLAGPMRGHINFNRPLFRVVARELRNQGVEVYDPAEADETFGDDTPIPCYAARDVAAILDMGALAVLPGWQHSTGARAEVALALWCQFPIYDAITLLANSGRPEIARIAPVVEARAV